MKTVCRYKDPRGYIMVKRPSHPNSRSNGYIREHRLIMSEYLGRPLLPNEDVHHKNGIKDDNRLENLELTLHPIHTSMHNKDPARPKRKRGVCYCHNH